MSPAPKTVDDGTYAGRFAIRLRNLREKAGLTVEQVVESIATANESGRKSPKLQAYYGWEQGVACPHLELLPAIAKALGTKIRTLLPES